MISLFAQWRYAERSGARRAAAMSVSTTRRRARRAGAGLRPERVGAGRAAEGRGGERRHPGAGRARGDGLGDPLRQGDRASARSSRTTSTRPRRRPAGGTSRTARRTLRGALRRRRRVHGDQPEQGQGPDARRHRSRPVRVRGALHRRGGPGRLRRRPALRDVDGHDGPERQLPRGLLAKYGSMPTKAKHLHEFALRVLVHAIETSAARYAARPPVLCLSIDFYIRVFVRVYKRPRR